MSTTGSVGEDSADSSFGAVYIKDPMKRRKCPLCQQNLYLYHLNYEEMMLMCENLDCDYPFGHEALQVVTDETELRDKPDPASDVFYMYPVNDASLTIDTSSTNSLMPPSSILSEEDHPLDSDYSTIELRELSEDTLSVRLKKETKLSQRRKERAREIEKKVKNIERLNNEMFSLSNYEEIDRQIKKEKWLNNLKTWEKCSGRKLLTDTEAKSIKKEEYSLGEITVNVETGSVPSFNIEICKKDI